MISHFSQEAFEGTLHIKDADLQKMAKVLNDVNIKECPYFDLSDKYGNSARYYRENQWTPCSERLPEYEKYVLVTFIDKSAIDTKVMCVRRIEGFVDCDWYWSDFADEYTWEASEVVAWMPLPNPWKEGQDETN